MSPAVRTLARRGATLVALLIAAPWTALAVLALFLETPPELLAPPPGTFVEGSAPRSTSVRITDRNGGALAELHDGDGEEARWVRLEDAPRVAAAIVAAEDRRFRHHLGIDPLRTARAAWDGLSAGRVVSGASTLSQQLARITTDAPRTTSAKIEVMALALRIEAELSKDAILVQYLNRAPFGARVRGVEAASRRFFDKPAAELSLAEAATLAALPQSPARLDPRREAGRARLLRRRDEILGRIAGSGLASADEVAGARAEPLVLAPRFSGADAPHFVRAVVSGAVDPCATGARDDRSPVRDGVVTVETTIDPVLQAAAAEAARRTIASIEDRHATSAAAVVLDNRTGDILAWVGSPGLDDTVLGHNDGVLARRQPGSTLKPFVYGLAIERLGFSPATLLPDVELSFPAKDGEYRPRNYDGAYHGPVLLREALGNSYNVPAVWTAQRLGTGPVVRRLRDVGLCSVSRGAEHYGLAIALGDAEVTLIELASAYATLARGGLAIAPRAVRRVVRWDGSTSEPTSSPARRVLDAGSSHIILDVLADPKARVGSFGERNVLELPFPFAAKTGTSKGFRDNLAVGVTAERTIAVWVGNMDGSPMRDVSGVTGAGPLLRAIAQVVGAGETPLPVAEGVEEVAVCAASGMRAGPDCPHTRRERVSTRRDPAASCDVHLPIAVDEDGALAAPGCPGTTLRRVEVWPPPFEAWARTSGRPVPPARISTRCPPPPELVARLAGDAAPRITFPSDGDRFHLDPGAAAPPAIEIVVRGVAARLELDGHVLPLRDGRARWVLQPGEHRLVARAGGPEVSARGGRAAPAPPLPAEGQTHTVSFSVE